MEMTYERLTSHPSDGRMSHDDALKVLEGLSGRPKRLPSELFYDEKGSGFFSRIMDLDEYYLTGCETEILTTYRERIAGYLSGETFNLIELGAGDGRKTAILLHYFTEQHIDFEFLPIDISVGAMQSLEAELRKDFIGEKLKVRGFIAEYFEALKWLNSRTNKKNIVLFLGSNIGNFMFGQTRKFLSHLWYSLNPDDLVLIGFDLKKDPAVLNRAYNDSEGITSEFNLNLLDRLNKELGADFDRRHFMHQGYYNVEKGACESFIVSTRHQTVNITALDRAFEFQSWEAVKTEESNKYLLSDVEELAGLSDFCVIEHFLDNRGFFVDSLWRVLKPSGALRPGNCK